MCRVIFIIFIIKWRNLFARIPDRHFSREKKTQRETQILLFMGAEHSRAGQMTEEHLETDDEKMARACRGGGGDREGLCGAVWH